MQCISCLIALFLLIATSNLSAQNYVFGEAQFGVGKAPFGQVSADFNGDAFPDLAVANAGSNTVSILLGNRQGNFHARVDYPVAGANVIIAGDFNGDSKIDLAVSALNGTTISILLGNGDGTFKPYIAVTAPVSNQFSAADLNGDGKLDLITANPAKSISVLLGNRDGTFQAAVNYSTDFAPAGLTLGDFNNDGKTDVAVAESFCTDTCFVESGVFLGNGDGTFQPEKTFASEDGSASSLTSGDFNHDGKLDLAITFFGGVPNDDVLILVGKGDGTFSLGPVLSSGLNSASGIFSADLNADGSPDLVVVETGTINGVGVFLGQANGNFSAPTAYGVGSTPQSAIAADFNHDGKLDLAVTGNFCIDSNPCAGSAFILLGNGHGAFTVPKKIATGLASFSIAAADLNGDGKPDVVLSSAFANNIAVLINQGSHFATPVNYTVGSEPGPVISADFNGDGKPDLAVASCRQANCNSKIISILVNNGDGTFATPVAYPAQTFPSAIVAADINHDGSLDLLYTVVISGVPGKVGVMLNNGDGTFTAGASYAVDVNPEGLSVGDFNGDGKLDLAVSNEGNAFATYSILVGNGDGTFQPAVTSPTGGLQGSGIASADLNGDGILDLIISNQNLLSIFFGNGNATFQTPTSFAGQVQGNPILADINNDGKIDVVVGTISSFAIYLGNGAGGFRLPLGYLLSNSFGLAVADINGDGKLDVLATDDSTTDNSIAVFLGSGH